jgi:hypothetical protein
MAPTHKAKEFDMSGSGNTSHLLLPEERYNALVGNALPVIASYSTDADDMRHFLDVLGIDPVTSTTRTFESGALRKTQPNV